MDYTINNMDSLEKLKREKSLKRSVRTIRLNIEDDRQSEVYERKLNRYYFACGCQEGAIGVYFSLVCCLLLWWGAGFAAVANWWKIGGVVAFSALGGKAFGLLLSGYKLKKIYRVLETRFNSKVTK